MPCLCCFMYTIGCRFLFTLKRLPCVFIFRPTTWSSPLRAIVFHSKEDFFFSSLLLSRSSWMKIGLRHRFCTFPKFFIGWSRNWFETEKVVGRNRIFWFHFKAESFCRPQIIAVSSHLHFKTVSCLSKSTNIFKLALDAGCCSFLGL